MSIILGNRLELRKFVPGRSAATAALILTLSSPVRTRTQSVAFAHVNVVDVVAGQIRRDMTVVIDGNRITEVRRSTRADIPRGARVIDGAGKYIMPGLWDMHVHLGDAGEEALHTFIAFGVTGVRDMGSPRFERIHRWSVEALSGNRVGPRIVAAGPILDGSGNDSDRVTVTSPDAARRAVDSLATVGVDFIKVHEHMTRDVYFAIAAEARRLALPFAGHVPANDLNFLVAGAEAAEAGQASLEHMFGIPFPAETGFTDLYAALRRHETRVDPTLVTIWSAAHVCDAAVTSSPDTSLAPLTLRTFWKAQIPNCSSPALRYRAILLERRMRGIKPLRDARVSLLAGTDVGFPYVIPGRSLHDELRLLVEAGLAPAEALRTATINPATYFHREHEMGEVATGRIADLVLLDDDPLRAIGNVDRINTVVANGRVFAAADLRALREFKNARG